MPKIFATATSRRRLGLASSVVAAFASACLTGGLLFINGSFVYALLSVMAEQGMPLYQQETTVQFLLFTLPMVMVFLQWLMIDYVRRRIGIRRRTPIDISTDLRDEAS